MKEFQLKSRMKWILIQDQPSLGACAISKKIKDKPSISCTSLA